MTLSDGCRKEVHEVLLDVTDWVSWRSNLSGVPQKKAEGKQKIHEDIGFWIPIHGAWRCHFISTAKEGKKTLDRLLRSYREGIWVNHCFQDKTARAIKQRFGDMGARASQRDMTMEAAIAWDLSYTGWTVEDTLHTNTNVPISRNQHKNRSSQFCATYNQKLN